MVVVVGVLLLLAWHACAHAFRCHRVVETLHTALALTPHGAHASSIEASLEEAMADAIDQFLNRGVFQIAGWPKKGWR